MKDTGHVPMAERPQAFNDVLVDFLAEERPADGRSRPRESQAWRALPELRLEGPAVAA